MTRVPAATVPPLRKLVAGRGRPPEAPGFQPMAVAVVDLEDPGRQPIRPDDGHTAAWVLARLHGRPLGQLTVTGPTDDPGDLEVAIRRAVVDRWGPQARGHLEAHRSGAGGETSSPLGEWSSCLLDDQPRTPAVSVIIPTCRRPEMVVRCVDSVLATGYPDLEVLVVDNAPEDERTATAFARRFGKSGHVRYLQVPTPGASRARNAGARSAGGEILAFLDDDVEVDPLWVAGLVDAFNRHPEVGCVTGLVIPASLDTPVQLWFEQFGGFNRGYVPRLFDLSDHPGDTLLYPYTAGALGGLANAAFRSSEVDRSEPFDVTLGPGTPAFGAEDQDAFISLLRSGGRLLYEPSALVRHNHRDSYEELRWQIFTYGAGMVAGLVHWGLNDRAVARELTARTLSALPAILSGGNRAQALVSASDDFPAPLRRLERLGHVYGPLAYARAVWRRRGLERRAGRGAFSN